MKVHIPTPLRSYTRESQIEATGATLGALIIDVDRQFPGLRFRIIDEQDGIRQHIKLFINQEQERALDTPLNLTDEVHIICALSGG